MDDDKYEKSLKERHVKWLDASVRFKHRVLKRTKIEHGRANHVYELEIEGSSATQPSDEQVINLADNGWSNFGGHIDRRQAKSDRVCYTVTVYVD